MATSFDRFAFEDDHQMPVSARRLHGGGFLSPGLSYEDYRRCSTQIHLPSGERRLPVPLWMKSPAKLQEVIVNIMEGRAGIGTPLKGVLTLRERLANAELRYSEQFRPGMIERITRLARQYQELHRCHLFPEYQRVLLIQIENLDTQLRIENWAGMVARVLYLYHLAAMDSPGVAAAVNLKPPCIRQIISRAGKIANTLWDAEGKPIPPPQMECGECGTTFDIGSRWQGAREFCGKDCQRKASTRRYREKKQQRRKLAAAAAEPVADLPGPPHSKPSCHVLCNNAC